MSNEYPSARLDGLVLTSHSPFCSLSAYLLLHERRQDFLIALLSGVQAHCLMFAKFIPTAGDLGY